MLYVSSAFTCVAETGARFVVVDGCLARGLGGRERTAREGAAECSLKATGMPSEHCKKRPVFEGGNGLDDHPQVVHRLSTGRAESQLTDSQRDSQLIDISYFYLIAFLLNRTYASIPRHYI